MPDASICLVFHSPADLTSNTVSASFLFAWYSPKACSLDDMQYPSRGFETFFYNIAHSTPKCCTLFIINNNRITKITKIIRTWSFYHNKRNIEWHHQIQIFFFDLFKSLQCNIAKSLYNLSMILTYSTAKVSNRSYFPFCDAFRLQIRKQCCIINNIHIFLSCRKDHICMRKHLIECLCKVQFL